MTDRIPVDPPERIELENDTLVLDEIFHREVLGGASRRTGKRYEKSGLPFVTLRGYKYRPLRAGREWLERQIQHPNTAPKRRVRAS
jgi:hypothetical protein